MSERTYKIEINGTEYLMTADELDQLSRKLTFARIDSMLDEITENLDDLHKKFAQYLVDLNDFNKIDFDFDFDESEDDGV